MRSKTITFILIAVVIIATTIIVLLRKSNVPGVGRVEWAKDKDSFEEGRRANRERVD